MTAETEEATRDLFSDGKMITSESEILRSEFAPVVRTIANFSDDIHNLYCSIDKGVDVNDMCLRVINTVERMQNINFELKQFAQLFLHHFAEDETFDLSELLRRQATA